MDKIMTFVKKYWVWIVIAIILLILLIRWMRKDKTVPTTTGNTNTGSNGNNTIAINWTDDSFPLKLYSQGERVKQLQTKINTKIIGTKKLSVDGKLGPQTESAINKLKSALGGVVNGQVSQDEFNYFMYGTLPVGQTSGPVTIDTVTISLT